MIRKHLGNLLSDLDELAQTTHGLLADGDAWSVSESIADCYLDPSPFTVSELAQTIRQFIKKEASHA